MYSPEEREQFFARTIENLRSSDLIQGVIQIGSGVTGYSDEYSDIDLMVSSYGIEDAESAKDEVRGILSGYNTLYIKEKQFSENIYLIIAILPNSLEFNVSIVPRELLTVRSPLWKIIFDKTGLVTEKMNRENDRFNNKPVKYSVGEDVPFEFAYCAIRMEKELKRNNLIYSLQMLEAMRDYTLLVQALNEEKKLHQFKAYDTLEPDFIEEYLSTFPKEINIEELRTSSERLKELFVKTVQKSSAFSMDESLYRILNLNHSSRMHF